MFSVLANLESRGLGSFLSRRGRPPSLSQPAGGSQPGPVLLGWLESPGKPDSNDSIQFDPNCCSFTLSRPATGVGPRPQDLIPGAGGGLRVQPALRQFPTTFHDPRWMSLPEPQAADAAFLLEIFTITLFPFPSRLPPQPFL